MVARTRGTQVAMTNDAHAPSERIDGLIPVLQDW